VPDNEDKSNNLAGKLSHPVNAPKVPVKYLGATSRFIKEDIRPVYELLILLSGPEPQRTFLKTSC
jgi:hypothetical protein